MKRSIRFLLLFLIASYSTASIAAWYSVNVTGIYVVADNAFTIPGLSTGSIVVFGDFTPSLPCSIKGFVLGQNDPLFKETYSMLVSARLTGTPISYFHVYCMDNGVARGNLYQL